MCMRHNCSHPAAANAEAPAAACRPCSRIAPNITRPNPGASSERLTVCTPRSRRIHATVCETGSAASISSRPDRPQARTGTGRPQVDDHAAALRRHRRQRAVEFRAAPAGRRPEHVAGQAFDVDVQGHGHTGTDRSDDQGQVLAAEPAGCASRKPMTRESPAPMGRIVSASRTTWGSVRRRYATSSPIETMGSPCAIGELDQFAAASHPGGTFARHDFAQRRCRSPPREPGQVDRRLGRSRPSQHSARPGLLPGPRGPGAGNPKRPTAPRRAPRSSGRDRSPRYPCHARSSRPTPGKRRCPSGHRRGGTSAVGSAARTRRPAVRHGHTLRCAGR